MCAPDLFSQEQILTFVRMTCLFVLSYYRDNASHHGMTEQIVDSRLRGNDKLNGSVVASKEQSVFKVLHLYMVGAHLCVRPIHF
ncbi:hypothetical protein Kkor_1001 [Kangiella koreensis DSM 16069]|uniref:Uncharacterized protein n=1 Tax=Kangiella koreensis (strain DSM 16069 / JCM 12317 / KCTC 12182 / SW-125) TaxID=523791 RepID=C7RAX9_KANKD|nr:hypothetical protein Kkor_1001 [Kangiella koreensis DSM 16069]